MRIKAAIFRQIGTLIRQYDQSREELEVVVNFHRGSHRKLSGLVITSNLIQGSKPIVITIPIPIIIQVISSKG